MSSADLLREAVTELYASAPDVFIARRRELVAHAREAGDKAAAQRIAGLHKPTRSAWLVNQLSRAEPQAADQLSGLGEELQAAQDSLDGAAIRDLSRRRRELLDELTRQVFGIAGLRQPPAALRDEVTGTLGAAMSDPGVAADLRAGTLTRAVQRAGLGDQGPDLASALAGLAAGAPGDSAAGAGGGGDTTVVRLPARRPGAGRDGSRSPGSGRAAAARPGRAAARGRAGGSSAPGTAKRPGGPVSELAAAREKAARERRQQAIAEADRALAAADRAVRKTSRAERDEESAVRELEAEAEDARRRLAEARQRLSGARAEAQRARASQRRAQQALAKAQR